MINSQFLTICLGFAICFYPINGFCGVKMQELYERFQKSEKPETKDLLGTWILIGRISTQKFITGMDGEDTIQHDIDGIMREYANEWVLEIDTVPLRGYRTISHTISMYSGGMSYAKISSGGDFLFSMSYGGDAPWPYRCRTTVDQHLICLFRGGRGGGENEHGVEFIKSEKPTYRISKSKAIEIAEKESRDSITFPSEIEPLIEINDRNFIVTYPMGLSEGMRGGDYYTKVTIDRVTGNVIEILVAP